MGTTGKRDAMSMTRRAELGSAAAVAAGAGSASAGAPALWREFNRTPFTHPQIPYVGRAGCRGGAVRFPRRPVVADICDFGAVADGTTDSAPAINRAIAAAGRAGGGTVTIPPGTFRIDDVIRVNRSNVVLKGAGSGRTTLRATKNTRGAPARQGSWTVRVSDPSSLRPGVLVPLRLADYAHHTLLEHMCGLLAVLHQRPRRAGPAGHRCPGLDQDGPHPYGDAEQRLPRLAQELRLRQGGGSRDQRRTSSTRPRRGGRFRCWRSRRTVTCGPCVRRRNSWTPSPAEHGRRRSLPRKYSSQMQH